MNLIVNEPGSYISKRGECICIKNKKEVSEISVRNIEQLMITTHISLSSDVIELAIENNIDIIFLKYNGSPFGRIWHSRLGSISTIRRKQLMLEDHPFGLSLIKEWLSNKIDNQMKFLRKLAMNRRDSRKQIINDCIESMNQFKLSIRKVKDNSTVNQVRLSLQGYEGNAGKLYFQMLGVLLPKKYRYEKRSKNPALDPFSCMLNYCYGILYSSVEKSCIIAGLDPYIGIMHTDNFNKKSFVYDLVENYRVMMDEMVFKLFSKNKVTNECFDIVNDTEYVLNKEGKKLVITVYNDMLEKRIRHDKRNIKIKNIIQHDLHKIANRLLGVDLNDNLGYI